MKDVMVDLETLGFVPGCAILSIGAVAFDELGIADDGFYMAVNCDGTGLFKDDSTVEWWKKQSPEARKVFDEVASGNCASLVNGLTKFNAYLRDTWHEVRVWGNGADFDNPILAAGYRAVSVKPGWKPYNGRCYRTVKNQFPDIKLQRVGAHHNALDDARSQALHLVEICGKRGWKLA